MNGSLFTGRPWKRRQRKAAPSPARVGVYQDHHNEWRCTAGQVDAPVGCERHPDHYWCTYCEGWFGIPHDRPGGCCSQTNASAFNYGDQCACRFHQIAQENGQAAAYAWRDERKRQLRSHGTVLTRNHGEKAPS